MCFMWHGEGSFLPFCAEQGYMWNVGRVHMGSMGSMLGVRYE